MLSVATGYDPDYLLKEVATGRENYYTGAVAEGEPPGRWWGAGAEKLGLQGEVDAQDMHALYSRFLDPRAEGFRDPSRWNELAESATLGHAGRAYKSEHELYAEALEREPHATAERRDELRVEAGKAARHNVAFLDVTFSVQKSVTLLHAAFEAEEVKARAAGLEEEAAEWASMRETVEQSIWRGNDAALSYLQDKAGYGRAGHHGGAAGRWVDAHEWTVASFFQHDSRDHDPQLHIHNAVINRAEGADGVWRTLDSRAIHRLKPAAAAVAERTADEALAHDLGVRLTMRPDGLAREVTVVTPETRDLFSSRSHKISGRAAELIEEFERSRGREATGVERDRIKRQATMATRAAKSHQGETRAEFLDRVDAELRADVAGGLAGIAHTGRAEAAGERAAPEQWSPSEVIDDALEAVQAKRASFTHAEVMREINARLPDHLGVADGAEVAELLHRLADQALELVEQVDQDLPGVGLEPDAIRRADGASTYAAPAGPAYVTRGHLRSENRLRAATVPRNGTALTSGQAAAFLARLREEGIELGVDQAAAVTGVLTSGARLETVIGPAGTGKSFVVGAFARAWSDPAHRAQSGPDRRVFGLATSQVATDILSAEGLTAANTARWLAAQQRLCTTGRVPLDGDEGWRLRRGDVVVVDESSMADTAALAEVHRYVDAAGAKMLLVGDPRQLAAVGAAGGMELVADAGARYELAEARRFTQDWERDASLRLRAGDPAVVSEYHRQGRLLDAGHLADAEASAARGWLADTLAGRRSLLIVDTNEQAERVSSSLRDELVRLGHVRECGVALRDGTTAGIGDVVEARRIAWDLAGFEGNRRGPINRERYRVTGVRDDGSLEVDVISAGMPLLGRGDDAPGAGERMVLPASYVAADVTLGYASTVHAVEGATVDTSHAVLTDRTSLNSAYTALSRGRDANTAHVATVARPDDPAQGTPADEVHRDPRAVLGGILDTREARDAAHRSALVAQEESAREARSVQALAERFADAAHLAALQRTNHLLDRLVALDVLGPVDRTRIAAEDGTAGLTRVLRQAELAGRDPAQVLHDAIADRPLDGARRVSDVVRGRIEAENTFTPTSTSWIDRIPRDVDEVWTPYLTALAQAADDRTAELGGRVAAEPSAWALETLGSVPEDEQARREWTARAGLIAGHRELHGVADDEREQSSHSRHQRLDSVAILGGAPPQGHVEAHAAYRAAHRAAGLPDYDRDVLELSPAAHRSRVRAWEREQLWGPAYVDNMLAGTRQAQDRARETAELRRADHDVASEPEQRDQLSREASHADTLAETLAGQVDKLDVAAQAYGLWRAETAATRANAEASRAWLADHHASDQPEPAVTADEWLAADRSARLEDDPHRTITDLEVEEGPVGGREDASQADSAATEEAERAGEDDGSADADQVGETGVPDVRESAAEWPTVDEDTVRTPPSDETEGVGTRAMEALAELRNRQAMEEQHEQEERADELARWSAADEVPAEEVEDLDEPEVNDDGVLELDEPAEL